jgi:protein SCO1/2
MAALWRALICCLTFSAVALSAAQGGAVQQQVDQSSVSQNPALVNVRVDQKPGAQLPLNAVFRDESGKQITFGSLFKGRPIVLLPIFYRCTGVCNLELQSVLAALTVSPKLLPGRDLDVVALGINPKEGPDLARDKKASILEEYGKPQSAAGWHFLTGDLANIRAVTDAMGFRFTYDPGQDIVNHPSGVMVLTPQGKVSVYMLRGTYQPTAFQEDVSKAAMAQIAPKSDDIFFGCVHVDPLTGKRSIVIQSVMRVFGVFTVLSILASIVVMSRKGRQTPPSAMDEGA